MKKFQTFTNYNGHITSEDGTHIYGWNTAETPVTSIETDTHLTGGCFGYVFSGDMTIYHRGEVFIVPAGFWFTTPGALYAKVSKDFRAVAFQIEDYRGTLSAGFVEDAGRLNYIDGCKDSILYSPVKLGAPCLNALYMPEGVNQTMHTHPSTRAGFIITGGAVCETPEGTHPLESGMIFFLPKDTEHKFRTDHGKDITMKLVAFHPDSDFGPQDEDHPMLNRTIVEGVSAKNIDEIRTKS